MVGDTVFDLEKFFFEFHILTFDTDNSVRGGLRFGGH